MPTQPPERDPWESATFEGAARANLLAEARMTMAEKLAWLEEMGRLARRLHASESKPSNAPPGGG